MRDPAMAAVIGALPAADYGHDSRRPQAGFGGFSPFDPSRNIGFGWEGFGADAPLPPPPAPPMPSPHGGGGIAPWQQAYQGYMRQHATPPFWDGRFAYYGGGFPTGPQAALAPEVWAAMEAATARRAAILDPNEHSRLKIERYSFSLSPAENFTLGTPVAFEATLQPNTRIRAQRVVMNAPVMNFVLVDSLQIANVNVLVGTTEDAFTYNANGQGVMLDLPTLDPANRATVSGSYTGLLPPGYASEFSYQFIVSFQGPSTLVGGL
jgi:hypothetical protein